MAWFPSTYDDLVMSEPGLIRYFPLDDPGNIASGRSWEYVNGLWLAPRGNTPATILRSQPPLTSDGRASTKVNAAAVLSTNGGAAGGTTGLPTGNNPWSLECWFAASSNGGYQFLIAYGAESPEAGPVLTIGGAGTVVAITSWNGAELDDTKTTTDGKPHHAVGTFDGVNLRLFVDGRNVGSLADTFTTSTLNNLCLGAMDITSSYANALTGFMAKAAVYNIALPYSAAVRHYLAGIQAPSFPLATPEQHSWPVLAVNVASGGTTNVNITDSGTGADSVAVAVALTVPDTGSGSDSEAVAVALTVPDTGGGADAVAVAASLTVADTGHGTEALSESVALTVADAGAGLDAPAEAVALTVADTALGADVVNVGTPIGVSDAGSGSDAVNVAAGLTVADSGHATEVFNVAVAATVPDFGLGSEAFSEAVTLTVPDTGRGTDSILSALLILIADSGVGLESISIAVLQNQAIFKPVGGTGLSGSPSASTSFGGGSGDGGTVLDGTPDGTPS